VLVEGDDMNEPVADHMRALLDGHIVLSRHIAHRGQLPAVDPLQSVSRWLGRLTTTDERRLVTEAQTLLSTYEASRDLVDMGAYQRGANPRLDRAVELAPVLMDSLKQTPGESLDRAEGYRALSAILAGDGVAA
jgi:flagellum-specific ATP synthase